MRVKTLPVVNVAALNSGGGAGGSGGGDRLASEERERYKAEIRQLRAELAMYDALRGLATSSSSSNDKETKVRLERESLEQVHAYVSDAAALPPIMSLRQVTAVLKAFRSVCVMNMQQQGPGPGEEGERLEDDARTASRSRDRSDSADSGQQLPAVTPQRSASKLVVQLRAIRGHTPPPSTSSGRTLPLIGQLPRAANGNQAEDGDVARARAATVLPPLPSSRVPASVAATAVSERSAEGEKELFERFRAAVPTPEAVLDVDAAKQNLRAARKECAELTQDVNRVKLYVSTACIG